MAIDLKIELSRQPDWYLVYKQDTSCTVCGGHYFIGATCMMCEFEKAGRKTLTFAGWNLTLTANQIICVRVGGKL